jgi:nuclear receptor interaction protein
MEQARYSVLNEAQRHSLRIAKGLVKLRKALFSLEASAREHANTATPFSVVAFHDSFSSALMLALTFLPQMEEIMRTWGYPINPTPEVVRVQQTLRRNRESAYRFVQAAGTLARALGGDVQDYGVDDDVLERFQQIGPAPGEDNVIGRREQFGYDFLKALILFAEGGRSAVLAGFKRSAAHGRNRDRFPIPQFATEGALEAVLIPYLHDLADDSPVVNVDSSRFEHDETRILFPSQKAAVDAFENALRSAIPNDTAGGTEAGEGYTNGADGTNRLDGSEPSATDSATSTTHFWLLSVGRGILMDAGTGVNFEFVNRSFGGLNATVEDDSDEEVEVERSQDDTEANVEEEAIQDISLAINRGSSQQSHRARSDEILESQTPMSTDTVSDVENFGIAVASSSSDEHEENDDDDNDDDDDENMDDSSESDAAERLFRSYGFERSGREDVENHVPCSSHTRVYRGHCNVKTVKDANFFGLNDEYVVSGSDSGHLFIWERDTCKLVNILKGDDEVVNVVQGTLSA